MVPQVPSSNDGNWSRTENELDSHEADTQQRMDATTHNQETAAIRVNSGNHSKLPVQGHSGPNDPNSFAQGQFPTYGIATPFSVRLSAPHGNYLRKCASTIRPIPIRRSETKFGRRWSTSDLYLEVSVKLHEEAAEWFHRISGTARPDEETLENLTTLLQANALLELGGDKHIDDTWYVSSFPNGMDNQAMSQLIKAQHPHDLLQATKMSIRDGGAYGEGSHVGWEEACSQHSRNTGMSRSFGGGGVPRPVTTPIPADSAPLASSGAQLLPPSVAAKRTFVPTFRLVLPDHRVLRTPASAGQEYFPVPPLTGTIIPQPTPASVPNTQQQVLPTVPSTIQPPPTNLNSQQRVQQIPQSLDATMTGHDQRQLQNPGCLVEAGTSGGVNAAAPEPMEHARLSCVFQITFNPSNKCVVDHCRHVLRTTNTNTRRVILFIWTIILLAKYQALTKLPETTISIGSHPSVSEQSIEEGSTSTSHPIVKRGLEETKFSKAMEREWHWESLRTARQHQPPANTTGSHANSTIPALQPDRGDSTASQTFPPESLVIATSPPLLQVPSKSRNGVSCCSDTVAADSANTLADSQAQHYDSRDSRCLKRKTITQLELVRHRAAVRHSQLTRERYASTKKRPPDVYGRGETTVPGMWCFVVITKYNRNLVMDAMIVSDKSAPILIGEDWMYDVGAKLDLVTSELVIYNGDTRVIIPFTGAGPQRQRVLRDRPPSCKVRLARAAKNGVCIHSQDDSEDVGTSTVTEVAEDVVRITVINILGNKRKLPKHTAFGTWTPEENDMEILEVSGALHPHKVKSWMKEFANYRADNHLQGEAELDIEQGLNPDQREMMLMLFINNSVLLAKRPSSPPVTTTNVQHHINTGTHPAFRCRSCRYAHSGLAVIDEHIDYRALNALTVKDVYRLPRLNETLDHFKGTEGFTTLDLDSGYGPVPVADEDKDKTATLHTEGAISIRADAVWSCKCTGKGSFERHLLEVAAALKRLANAGMTLNPQKCSFVKHRLEYLGHELTKEGTRPMESMVNAVCDFPAPSDIDSVSEGVAFNPPAS
ncbi:hypothetical protein ON010_g12932 [Phytophthora cinnamomi]|nr:hypothetical protein ON010_g12932 [Phytophthora cinnamomi]